jgi:hypothetical protein
MHFVIFLTNSCYSVYARMISFIRRQRPAPKTGAFGGNLVDEGVFTRALRGGEVRKGDAVDIVIE